MGKGVITSGARTAVGAFLGGLKTVPVEELAATAIKEALKRSNNLDPHLVNDVVLGHVESSGDAPNLGKKYSIACWIKPCTGIHIKPYLWIRDSIDRKCHPRYNDWEL